MADSRRLTELTASIRDRLDLPATDLVVALSGGADSATLAYLCSGEPRLARALHVNHGLPASAQMQTAAVEIAHLLDLDLEIRAVTLDDGPSPEGLARSARYRAFSDAMGEGESLLTAHTLDDSVETVLFNLIRGTGPRGLAGIPRHRPPATFRPLLDVTRSETREVATLAGMPFVDDPMNDDLNLSRAYVRRRLYPVMAGLNPRFSSSVARASRALSADNELLDEVASGVEIAKGRSASAVAVSSLQHAPRPVVDRVLKNLLAQAVGDSGVSADRVAALRRVLSGESSSWQLGDGANARIEGPMLVVGGSDGSQAKSMDLVPGINRHGRLALTVLEVEEVARVLPLSRWSAVFRAGVSLSIDADGSVAAEGEPAWVPGQRRLPVAWYTPGDVGYLLVSASEVPEWT